MLLELSPQTRDQTSLLPEEPEPKVRDHSAQMWATAHIKQHRGKSSVAVGCAPKLRQ